MCLMEIVSNLSFNQEVLHAGAVCEELKPMGRTQPGGVHGGLSPVGGTPHCNSRGRSSRNNLCQTNHNPIASTPVQLMERT